eukprot:5138860-Pyramimonas_sp.AAC.1
MLGPECSLDCVQPSAICPTTLFLNCQRSFDTSAWQSALQTRIGLANSAADAELTYSVGASFGGGKSYAEVSSNAVLARINNPSALKY